MEVSGFIIPEWLLWCIVVIFFCMAVGSILQIIYKLKIVRLKLLELKAGALLESIKNIDLPINAAICSRELELELHKWSQQ